MNYTDLHCDTAFELYRQGKRYYKNDLHICAENLKKYSRYSQVFAVWSDNDLSDDENFAEFFKIRSYLLENLSECGTVLCTDGASYVKNAESNINTAVLAVEGGKLISDDLSRIDMLYEAGVRFFTLVWKYACKIGGAFNTEEGLTDFGKKAVKKLAEKGIVIDLSHASVQTFYDTLETTDKVVVATHSNSKSIFGHRRNLTDAQFREIKRRGGVTGINLYSNHVAERAEISDVIRHIDHYLSLGGEDNVCFGCDFDGAPSMAGGIRGVRDIEKFVEEFIKIGYNNLLIEKLFYKNADNFIAANI